MNTDIHNNDSSTPDFDDSHLENHDTDDSDSGWDEIELGDSVLTRRHRFITDLLLSHTFRMPKRVTKVRIYRDRNMFAVCPRCSTSMEYEYQLYCNCCGQCLDWSKYDEAEEEFIGWNGTEPKEDEGDDEEDSDSDN